MSSAKQILSYSTMEDFVYKALPRMDFVDFTLKAKLVIEIVTEPKDCPGPHITHHVTCELKQRWN